MKLTKYHKEAIVSSILNDLPSPDEKQLQADIQTAFVAAMSTEAQALYATSPKALATSHFYGDQTGLKFGKVFIVGDADVKEALKPYSDAQKSREAIRRKLKAAIGGMNTRKQFIDAFPEFSHYAPPEPGPTANLPALANIVADLVKAGWVQKVSRA